MSWPGSSRRRVSRARAVVASGPPPWTAPAPAATPWQAGPRHGRRQVTERPDSIDATIAMLGHEGYVAGRALGTVTFLALTLGKPLFLEGEAGTGKTEIAKTLAAALGRRLIRLQCYEGLDAASAIYEWNFSAQMVA